MISSFIQNLTLLKSSFKNKNTILNNFKIGTLCQIFFYKKNKCKSPFSPKNCFHNPIYPGGAHISRVHIIIIDYNSTDSLAAITNSLIKHISLSCTTERVKSHTNKNLIPFFLMPNKQSQLTTASNFRFGYNTKSSHRCLNTKLYVTLIIKGTFRCSVKFNYNICQIYLLIFK